MTIATAPAAATSGNPHAPKPTMRDVYGARQLPVPDLSNVVAEKAPPVDWRRCADTALEQLPPEDREPLGLALQAAAAEFVGRPSPMRAPSEAVRAACTLMDRPELCWDHRRAMWTYVLDRAGECTPQNLDVALRSMRGSPTLAAPPQSPLASLPPSVRFGRAFEALPPPVPFLWDGIIARGETTVFSGDKGTYKSALLLRLMIAVASGRDQFADRDIASGAVVYVRTEDDADFDQRLAAACQHLGVGRTNVPLVEIREAIDIATQEGRDRLADLLEPFYRAVADFPPVALVVFDTAKRCCPSVDLNRPNDCLSLVDGADAVAKALGAAVVLVGHTPKGSPTIAYGAQLLASSASSSLILRRNRLGSILSCDRIKCAEPFRPIQFRVERVSVECEMRTDGDADDPPTSTIVVASSFTMVHAGPAPEAPAEADGQDDEGGEEDVRQRDVLSKPATEMLEWLRVHGPARHGQWHRGCGVASTSFDRGLEVLLTHGLVVRSEGRYFAEVATDGA